ncbi:LTA synthase family protein [Absicoccus porci]|uniref:LTA synthase family protein n=1 Tax=Absicoccus porci TaxID=2486576 RepID=UPI003F88CDE1
MILAYIPVFVCLTLLVSAKWSFSYFGLSCFEQIIFHLKVPLEGTNTEFITDWVKKCGIKALGLTIIVYFIQSWFFPHPFVFIHILCAASLIWAAHTVGMFEWIINQFRKTDLYETYFVDTNTVKMTFPEKKQNLIYIFVESLETTYTSKENGGDYPEDLIPHLSRLGKEHLNFSHQEQLGGAHVLAGTGWTTGGIVAQTSGVGLTVPLTSHRFKEGVPFLEKTKTLQDILHEEGYQQEFCIGSQAAFGGRKFYFDTHGPVKIFDYNTVKNQLPANYPVFWGFEDEKLFAYAKEEITKMASKDQPFHFSMLTVDTHHPKGYKDRHYQNQYPERLSNIIHESDRKIGEFIQWIQAQPFYKDTTIVICGDHTSMAEEYISHTYDPSYDRTTFNTIIHAKNKPKQNKNRKFTSFDFFPTVLSAMGVKIEGDRLGFGTNLFSDQKTIPEKIGYKRFDKELRKQSKYYWEHIL